MKTRGMAGLFVITATVSVAGSFVSAATFELNPSGTFVYSSTNANGTTSVISDLGARTLDAAFLARTRAALLTPVNGHTSNLNPVVAASAPDITITLDTLRATSLSEASYPGGGWDHEVRYNGAGLDDWRMIWLFGRTYAPDAINGFANLSYEQVGVDSYNEDFLTANFPFFREAENRNGTNGAGPFGIAESYSTTWYTIKGSWLDMENTFMIARANGDNLEIAGAWGFHEHVTAVPAPAGLATIVVGLGALGRRRRT